MTSKSFSEEELERLLMAAQEGATPGPDCPDPDDIWLAVAQELPKERQLAVVAHASTCPACTQAWRMAKELNLDSAAQYSTERPAAAGLADRIVEDEQLTSRHSGGHKGHDLRYLPQLAAAAAVALVAALVLFRPGQNPDEMRGTDSGLSSSVSEDTVLTRQGALLRWEGVDEATHFDVVVTWVTDDSSGFLVELENYPGEKGVESIFELSSQDLEEVPSRARILWRVTAKRGTEELDQKTFSARFVGTGLSP